MAVLAEKDVFQCDVAVDYSTLEEELKEGSYMDELK